MRQISCADAPCPNNAAVVERLNAGEYFEQRRFAGAIRANDTHAIVGRNKPIEIFEEEFMAEALACAGELDHTSG